MSKKSMTAGQIKQFIGFVRDVVANLGISFAQAQAFISNPDLVSQFKQGVKDLLNQLVQINPFIKERVRQNWFYPKNWQAKSVAEQIAKLVTLFPGIDLSQVEKLAGQLTMPGGADGIAVLPKLSFSGKFFGVDDPYGRGYGPIICKKLFEFITSSRKFCNYRLGEMDAKHIRIYAEVKTKLIELEENTPGDALVLPFNFGNLYAGWSPRAARWEALNNNQLPLTTSQVACLLLTMPDRLTAHEHLWIDCPGDEYDWDADGMWSHCPYFYFQVGRLEFYAYWSDTAHDLSGSVSAFLGV